MTKLVGPGPPQDINVGTQLRQQMVKGGTSQTLPNKHRQLVDNDTRKLRKRSERIFQNSSKNIVSLASGQTKTINVLTTKRKGLKGYRNQRVRKFPERDRKT